MKADGSGFVKPQDLVIGEFFKFLGKTALVYNCDDFTQKYYESIGIPQDMSKAMEKPPSDSFSKTIEKKNKSLAGGMKRTNEKIYTEV